MSWPVPDTQSGIDSPQGPKRVVAVRTALDSRRTLRLCELERMVRVNSGLRGSSDRDPGSSGRTARRCSQRHSPLRVHCQLLRFDTVSLAAVATRVVNQDGQALTRRLL